MVMEVAAKAAGTGAAARATVAVARVRWVAAARVKVAEAMAGVTASRRRGTCAN